MSAYGMTVTILATGLAEAVSKDEANGDGDFDLSHGRFGKHVSDWIKEVAKIINETTTQYNSNGDKL